MPRYRFDPDRSTLSVDGRSSVHPIRATADGVVGWIELADGRPASGHVTVEVERLRTGNPFYDREIRNRLDASRFPTFEAHLGTVHDDEAQGLLVVTGSVSAHGAQVDLDGRIGVAPDGDGLRVTGTEEVDFRRFDLKAPRLLTLKVDPIVTVVLDAVTGPPDD